MLQPVIYWRSSPRNNALENSARHYPSLRQLRRVLWSPSDDDLPAETDRLHRENVSAPVGNLHPQRNSGAGTSRTRAADFLAQTPRGGGGPGKRWTYSRFHYLSSGTRVPRTVPDVPGAFRNVPSLP